MFEGVVGKNSLGNIAIDDVSMIPGVCPSEKVIKYAASFVSRVGWFL